MFSQAIWLSDICSGDGKEILQVAWNGTYIHQSIYQWPQVPTLSAKDQTMWQPPLLFTVIKSVVGIGYPIRKMVPGCLSPSMVL